MCCNLDLTKIPLDRYHTLLKTQTLLPSRRLLLDDIDDQFARIRAQGVTTVAQLLSALSSPAKVSAFSEQSGVGGAYLTVLRREAGTLKMKSVPLSAFPDTDAAQIAALARQGIKTTKAYIKNREPGGRLYALCQLSRIHGVSPITAAMFYAAGSRSLVDVAEADATELLARVSAANRDQRYYAGTLGEKDIQFCIDFAKKLLQLSV